MKDFPSGYMSKEDQERAWRHYQDTALPNDKPQPVPGATLTAPRAGAAARYDAPPNDPLEAQYVQTLQGQRTADEAQRSVAAGKAVEINPDHAAKVIRLHGETGLPRDTIDRRAKEVEAHSKQLEDQYATQMTHPVIQNYLKDPYNAAMVKDDPSFDLLDKMLTSLTRSYHNVAAGGEVQAAMANGRYIQQLEAVELAEAEGKLDSIKDDKDWLGFRFMTPEQRNILRDQIQTSYGNRAVELANRLKIIQNLPGIDPIVAGAMAADNASTWWYYFSQKPLEYIATLGAESAVQSLAIGAAAFASGGNPVVAAGVAGMSSYSIDYGASIIEALRNEGINLQDQGAIEAALKDKNIMKRVASYAHSHAAPVALLDAIAGGRAGAARSARDILQNQLEQSALGAIGEALGQTAQGKELHFGEIAAEFFGEMVTAPIESSGAVLATWRQHLQAKEMQSFFAALGSTAEASKLRERMPEHLQGLVNKITADGPIENVYIEPRAFVQYFQSKNISPSKAARDILGTDAPLQEALAQGHDLQIPLGAYVAKVAGTEHNAPLSQDLKFDPTDLSVRETEALMQDMQNQVQIEKNRAEQATEGEKNVGELVSEQLQKAGFEKNTADTLAKQMDAFFETQAARTGRRSGLDLFKEYLFRIMGQKDQPKDGGQEIVQDQPAWHGSKHIFQKFDISKIGTGQGAQVHGWGLYFAKQKATADINYRRKYGGLKVEGVSGPVAELLLHDKNWTHSYMKAQTDRDRGLLLDDKLQRSKIKLTQAIQARVQAEKGLGGGKTMDEYRAVERDWQAVVDALSEAIDTNAANGFKIGYGGRLYQVDLKVEDSEMLNLETPLSEQRAGFDRQIILDKIKELENKITGYLLEEVGKYQKEAYDLAEEAPIRARPAAMREAERKIQDFEDRLSNSTYSTDPEVIRGRDEAGDPVLPEQIALLQLHDELGTMVFVSKEEKNAAINMLVREYENTITGLGLDTGRTGDAEQFYMDLTDGKWSDEEVGGLGPTIRWVRDFMTRWDDTVTARIAPEGQIDTPIAKLLNNPIIEEVLTDYAGYRPGDPDTGRDLYKALVAAAKDGMNAIYDAIGDNAPKMHTPEYVKIEQFRHGGQLWWHLTYWDENDQLLWGGDATVAEVSAALPEEDFNDLMYATDEMDVPADGKESATVTIAWHRGGPLPEITKRVNRYRTPEEVASKFLLSQGIKGLNYVGGQDGPAMVIFDDSLIDIIGYEQAAKTKDATKVIKKFAKEYGFEWDGKLYRATPNNPALSGVSFYAIDPETAQYYKDSSPGAYGEVQAYDVPPIRNPLVLDLDKDSTYTLLEKLTGDSEFEDIALHIEKALPAIREAGFDSVIINGETGPDVSGTPVEVVVFDPKSAVTLDQKDKDAPRGRMLKYGNYEYDIQLLETADLSTFLHESGHLYLEILWNLAAEPNAPEQLRKDFTTILKWVGAEPGKPLAYEQHEQFARGIEAYFMEGKAPSADLRGAFARFRAWLMLIYRKITNLNVRLSPEIREVMDRMFATDAAIEAAQQEDQLIPVFTTPEEANMTPDEFERYLSTIEKANVRANEELQTKLMKQWTREQTAWWAAQRDLVREEVRSERAKDKGVIAYTLLRFGKDPNGNELPEEQQIKLDRQAIIAMYGDESHPTVQRMRKYNLYRKTGGIAPDAAAELLGFKSGDELVQAVLNSIAWKAEVEQRTDELMKDRYGDMLIDGTMADQATEAVNNYDRSKILHAELKALTALRNKVAPFVQQERNRQRAERSRGLDAVRGVPSLEIFQRMAKQQIGAMPLRTITPNKFLIAARRAAVESVDAATKGDYTTAARAKQQQLFNLELYREARNAVNEVERMVDFAKKMGTPSTRRRIGTAGGDFLDQIDAILERFDFKPVSALTSEKRLRLTEWIAQKERQGITVDLPDYVVQEAYRKPYKSLTLDELRGVYDSLKHIDHLARLKNKLLKAKDKRDLQIVLNEIDAQIRESGRKYDKSKLGKRLPQDEVIRFIDSYFASHRKLASLIREMDGFKDAGPLWTYVLKPLNDASNAEATMIHQAGEKLKELFAPYVTTKEQLQSMATSATAGAVQFGMYKREHVPEINDSMSKMERLMVALNLGNEDNRTKLKAGYGWSDAQIEAVISPLTKEDWDFVQGVWDFVDSYWPQIAAKERRVKGIAPERVLPTPVRTAYGEYKGGYFPLKYEERSPGGQRAFGDRVREAAELMMKGAYTQATTRRGHTKERVEGVKMPVRLDFGVIYEHVHQVVHDLAMHEALIDANKIIGARQTQIAIVESYGDIAYDQLRHALESIAAGEIPAQTPFEKSVNWLRHGVSIAAMGWNLMTALLQPLGLSQSIVRIGAPWVFKGVMRSFSDAASLENTAKWVHAKSEFMRNRHITLNREINEIRNKVKGELGVTGNSFFWLIGMGQRIADFPTWIGMYEKQMAGGKDEETAIALADQAVLDSQGGGQIKDLAQIQRGTPLMKLWTNFYSYFNVTYNMTAESVRRTNYRSPLSVAALALDLLLLYTVPAVLGFMMKEALRGDPPEDDLVKRLAMEQMGYILGTMAGFREFSSVVQGYFGYEGPAGTRFYSEMSQFIKQAGQAEWDEALWKSLNNTAGIVLHYPAGQVQRTVDGFVAWTEDRAGPMAILAGPPKEK